MANLKSMPFGAKCAQDAIIPNTRITNTMGDEEYWLLRDGAHLRISLVTWDGAQTNTPSKELTITLDIDQIIANGLQGLNSPEIEGV